MALTRPKIWDLDTSVEWFKDPITVLHQGSTTANVDVGFLFNRANGLISNVALVWSETAQSFVAAYTNSSGATDTNVAATSYANITVGNVYANAFFYSNGTQFIGGSVGSSTYSNVNVAAYLSGTVSVGNVVTNQGVYWPNGAPYSSGTGITYTASSSAPTSPNSGDLWYNTTSNVIYTYTYDGISSYWLDTEGPSVSYGVISNVTVSANGSSISSGNSNVTTTTNSVVISSGNFTTAGDATAKQYVLFGNTASPGPVELFIGNQTNNRIPIRSNTTMYYTAEVVAKRTDGVNDYAMFTYKSAAANFMGNTIDLGLPYEIITARTNPNIAIDMTVSNSSGSLNLYAYTPWYNPMRWVAYVQTVEVSS